MNKTTILIVEDDMIIAADLSLHLTRMNFEVIGILARGEDAIQQIKDNPPDIILMDIQLKGHLDGIETSSQIQTTNDQIIIIFLTSNSDEATYNRAKKTKPHAFISKPFKRLDLGRAIELALLRKQENNNESLENIETTMQLQNEILEEKGNGYILKDRIFVKYKNKMVKLFLQDILYAEADRSYCKVFTSNKFYLMTMPLKLFEDKLSSGSFLRVHRSFIINLTKVETISDNCENVYIGQKNISISRGYKEELKKRLRLV